MLEIDGEHLTLADVRAVAAAETEVSLSLEARSRMQASRAVVEGILARERTVYGINTGFGVFSEVRISDDHVLELQRNLIQSHCAGVGEPYPQNVVRAMMLLRANALAKGLSGIRVEVVELLLRLLDAGVVPVIPSQGSVGASGDLAPLAHLAGVLMGMGEVWMDGQRRPADEGLASIGAAAVVFEAKEGLAMINGTQAITAVGGLALDRAWMMLDLADVVSALTLDVLRGTDAAFDARIHAARPHAGQVFVAKRLRKLLQGSPLRESHRNCGKVQDAYSLRCIPQVHGAVRDALSFVGETFAIEINAATDNPLVFSASDEVISGGNFHGAPVALACDIAAIALTDLASISERRIERLVNPQLSGLPPFLVKEGGVNSGFMIAQVTAAALVSECRVLSHPASVDSIPTSANKEDHVSMGPIAAWKLSRIVDNLESVIAIEAVCAAQGLEFRRPLTSSGLLESVVEIVRSRIAPWETDRYLHTDLIAARELLPRIHQKVRPELA
ncbi:MAG: histidine ammonia-lyase [Acidobacteriota bacterium]